MYFPISQIFEAGAFLASTAIYFRQEKSFLWRTFPPFMFITLLVEILGYETAVRGITNIPLFNAYLFVCVPYYLFVLRHLTCSIRVKQWILIVVAIYVLAAVLFFKIQGPEVFNTYTYLTGAICIVIFAGHYFYELMKKQVMGNLLSEPALWICTGLLFFFSCTIPILGTFHYVFDFLDWFIDVKVLILQAVNIIFYSILSIAFLKGYSLSSLIDERMYQGLSNLNEMVFSGQQSD